MIVYKKTVGEIQATYNKKNEIQAVKISSSNDINQFVRNIYPVDIQTREAMMAVYLNRANNVLSYSVISIGGLFATCADPKVIFQHALLANASSIILVHNHPSGNVEPSIQDKQLTNKIKKCGEFMDMKILDHIIIGDGFNNYFSFADELEL